MKTFEEYKQYMRTAPHFIRPRRSPIEKRDTWEALEYIGAEGMCALMAAFDSLCKRKGWAYKSLRCTPLHQLPPRGQVFTGYLFEVKMESGETRDVFWRRKGMTLGPKFQLLSNLEIWRFYQDFKWQMWQRGEQILCAKPSFDSSWPGLFSGSARKQRPPTTTCPGAKPRWRRRSSTTPKR